jgi:hypothetical protein
LRLRRELENLTLPGMCDRCTSDGETQQHTELASHLRTSSMPIK